eukprot:scaffold10328_cov112-Isochrysis_galbana.AAC.3
MGARGAPRRRSRRPRGHNLEPPVLVRGECAGRHRAAEVGEEKAPLAPAGLRREAQVPHLLALCEVVGEQHHGGGPEGAVLEGHGHVAVDVGLDQLARRGAVGARKELSKVDAILGARRAVHVGRLVD